VTDVVDMVELVDSLPGARVFEARRSVRLGDVSPGGRARLDALVRYLQDVSDDDTRDAGLADTDTDTDTGTGTESGGGGWVVRRTSLRVTTFPGYQEPLHLRTWCAATGARWAERRVSVSGPHAQVQAAVLWVHVDPRSMRPLPLSASFRSRYGPSTGGRTVSAKLRLGQPPEAAVGEPWPLRFTDFDALRHVNNAAVWEAVEEQLGRRRELRAPLDATVEHRLPIERDDQVSCVVAPVADRLDVWLVLGDGRVAVAASVRSVGT
jgi:acyl-ACP thioesterase